MLVIFQASALACQVIAPSLGFALDLTARRNRPKTTPCAFHHVNRPRFTLDSRPSLLAHECDCSRCCYSGNCKAGTEARLNLVDSCASSFFLAGAVAGAGAGAVAVAVAVAGAGAVAGDVAGDVIYSRHTGTSWIDFCASDVTLRISMASVKMTSSTASGNLHFVGLLVPDCASCESEAAPSQ